MNKDIVKKRIKRDGVLKTTSFYICKAASLAEELLICKVLRHVLTLRSDVIVFKNRQGQDFTDNAKALFEYLVSHGYNKKYKIVWLVSSKKGLPLHKYKNVSFVTAESRSGFSSLMAYYYGNTAGHFFYTNNTADMNRYHLDGQMIINLWHGCGYKGTTHGNQEMKYRKSMEAFDLALVPGELFVDAKARYWECDRSRIVPLGYPRYDWLMDDSVTQSDIVDKLYPDIDEYNKLILWMPTFRNSDSLVGFAENNIEFKLGIPLADDWEKIAELNRLCEREKLLLLIKKHPIQTKWKFEKEYNRIKFIDDEFLAQRDVLLYHLIGVSDALISDYSSAAVDYMLKDRPLAFVLSDYDEYKKSRGFVFDNPLAYMPGHKVYDFEQLKNFISEVANGMDRYRDDRRALLGIMHNKTDAYCKRLVEFLKL